MHHFVCEKQKRKHQVELTSRCIQGNISDLEKKKKYPLLLHGISLFAKSCLKQSLFHNKIIGWAWTVTGQLLTEDIVKSTAANQGSIRGEERSYYRKINIPKPSQK